MGRALSICNKTRVVAVLLILKKSTRVFGFSRIITIFSIVAVLGAG